MRDDWISVNDERPENNSFVIAIHPSKSKLAKNGQLVTLLEYKNNQFYNSYRSIQSVTHWMPLPEPPEIK